MHRCCPVLAPWPWVRQAGQKHHPTTCHHLPQVGPVASRQPLPAAPLMTWADSAACCGMAGPPATRCLCLPAATALLSSWLLRTLGAPLCCQPPPPATGHCCQQFVAVMFCVLMMVCCLGCGCCLGSQQLDCGCCWRYLLPDPHVTHCHNCSMLPASDLHQASGS